MEDKTYKIKLVCASPLPEETVNYVVTSILKSTLRTLQMSLLPSLLEYTEEGNKIYMEIEEVPSTEKKKSRTFDNDATYSCPSFGLKE